MDGEDLSSWDGASDAAKELALLRATSRVYASLLHSIRLTFESDGMTVRTAGEAVGPEPIHGLIPCLVARKGADLFVVEFATAAMIANAHLAARMKAFAQIRSARLWLVVPFDVLPDARGLIAKVGGGWKPVPGHV
jgi:hypothetical protein